MTSQSGAIQQCCRPYGGQRGTAEVATDRRYTGQRWQAQFGLYDYNARWYDPELGRFVQPDTVVPEPGNPQSLNRYAYCLNNPVRYTDPSGCYIFEEDPEDPWVYSDASVRSQYWYTHPEAKVGQPSDAEIIAAMTAPLWASAAIVGGMAAGETLVATGAAAGKVVGSLVSGLAADGDPTNEVRAAGEWVNKTVPSGARLVQRWGPHTGAGPLGENIANTFGSGSYSELVLTDQIELYRVWGGAANELGRYWTRTMPLGAMQAQMDLALAPEWGNAANRVVHIAVPNGTRIYEGIAASQGGAISLLGGGNQVFMTRVDPRWIIR